MCKYVTCLTAISEHTSYVSCPVLSVGNEIGGLRLLRYGGLKPVCRVRCEVLGAMATKSAVIYPEDGDRIFRRNVDRCERFGGACYLQGRYVILLRHINSATDRR